jgi:hypothetical protein
MGEVARRLQVGDLILLNAKPWLVERSNDSSAYVVPVLGEEAVIRTRRGLEKTISRRRAGLHIASTSYVEIVDPTSEYAKRVREGYMSETVETGEKRVRKQRTGYTYVRTEKEASAKLGGQGKIILTAIEEFGPTTSAALAVKCDGAFSTRQPVERVVAFYLAKFKREGLVVAVKEDGSPAVEEAPVAE